MNAAQQNAFEELWAPVTFEVNECRVWEVGPVRFWVVRAPQEWLIAFEHEDGEEDRFSAAVPCDRPEDVSWERWAMDEEHRRLHLEPVMPDRPVIVRPENRLNVPPGERLEFFVGVPFWIRIGEKNRVVFKELPTRILSNSWFGDPTQGELCYMSVTGARRTVGEMHHKAFRAISTIEIRNDYHDNLALQRICVRGPYLNIYQGENHLWTNEHRIVYQGPNELSKLVMARSGPSHDKANRLLGPARNELKRGLFTRSLGTLNPSPV